MAFAFTDVHAKLVYDVSTANQISVTALGGRSALDEVDEPLVGPLANGTDKAALVSVGWRSTLGARTVIRQRMSFVGQDLLTTLASGQLAGHSTNRALEYRGEALRTIFGGVLEGGMELSRISGDRRTAIAETGAPADTLTTAALDAFAATWATRAAYINFRRAGSRRLSFESGVRVSDSTLIHDSVAAPWIRAAWRFKPALALTASAGGSRQFPALEAVMGPTGSAGLAPERATHVDVGIEHRLANVFWQATIFDRQEHDIVGRSMRDPLTPGRYRNAFAGSSRGVELLVTPRAVTRASGWASYTYAKARQTDGSTHEVFWSDVDRRHALNAAGVLRVGRQSSVGLVLRAASGVPIPGYFNLRNRTRFAGDRRNEVRLPAYIRLDVRAQRTFFASRHAVSVFGEALNLLNRYNEGLSDGVLRPDTGEAVGFVRPLLHRTISFGIEVSLAR